jgi:hypothetical protein
MNEKRALDLLIKIATKQQNIIEKIAEKLSTANDPMMSYLVTAIPNAAVLAGLHNATVTRIEPKPSVKTDAGVQEGGYMVTISGIPANMGQKFKEVWDSFLAANKPELVGKVSFILDK